MLARSGSPNPGLRRVLGLALLGSAMVLLGFIAFVTGVLEIRGEKVRIPSQGIELAARLAIPRWSEGPHAAAVIVHGSGEVRGKHLRGYGRMLAPQGMVVLMYDKRGVGDSGGVYSSIGVADSDTKLRELAGDAAAAVRYLLTRDDIDPTRIGLIGGSQAGWIMPLAAAMVPEIDYLISISGPAVTYGEENHYRRLTGNDPGPYSAGELSDTEIREQMRAFEGPHGYDPQPVLETLTAASLWILGGRDPRVPTYLSVLRLEALQTSRPGSIDLQLYPQGDHELLDLERGKRLDYRPVIFDWLRKREMLQD